MQLRSLAGIVSNSVTCAGTDSSSFAILIAYGEGVHTMPAAVKAPERKSTRANPEEDDIATGIIKGLKDFKEGRFTRLKNAEELAEHFRSL